MKTWRCFHCDEVLRTPRDARLHFGDTHGSEPACLVKAPGEFALLTALRNAEEELARYRREDSDVLRAMWSMQADHATALRREEENGYERGLRDAKAHPETIGLQRATQETRALCPHGMPLAENVCGPCSEGRPNTVTRTVWTKNSDSDPYCVHCGEDLGHAPLRWLQLVSNCEPVI